MNEDTVTITLTKDELKLVQEILDQAQHRTDGGTLFTTSFCDFCDKTAEDYYNIPHAPDCPRMKILRKFGGFCWRWK